MTYRISGLALAGVLAALAAGAAAQSNEPFKIGTFEHGSERFAGLVVGDRLVARLDAADASLPREVPGIIADYDTVRARLQAIAARVARQETPRPAFVLDLKSVKVLPPMMPGTILNAAVNYTEHAVEMARPAPAAAAPAAPAKVAAPPPSIPGIWQRKPGDTRQNPYLFMKARSAVIADGESIRIPPGRDRIDWECELSIVVGRPAGRVPVERAAEFIFGYTLQNDVSDRGGREDGRHGSDWLIGKSHDTFAPLGPFVVPREFVPDPQKLAIKFTLNGKVMQDSSTDRMTHTVHEVLSYASHIMTLAPGDVISTGSPAGVGTARATPVYMKAGDVAVCAIERIGVLTNPVR
jgi:2-keto-4-pentenoate hydratase/2-oxohepta-3-ene-1,7-dioic acid hydratase in catechol pathway